MRPPTHQQIAALAHELWIGRGCPTGSDLDIWLEAERELRGVPAARSLERDPLPVDPARAAPDEDIALEGDIERELRDVGGPPGQRSPTSL